MSNSKKRVRQSVPKTKTFAGCWTCRSRKVKCDGKRPVCDRCLKTHRQCGGYDIQLYWITDDDTVAPSAIKRQAVNLTGLPLWTFDLEKIDQQLAFIDALTKDDVESDVVSSGPFNIFLAFPSDWFKDHSISHQDVVEDELTDEDFDLMIQLPQRRTSAPSLRYALNSSIFGSAVVDILVINYVYRVANILTPFSHPENPYTSIYVPKALDGATAIDLSPGLLLSPIPPANIAVFYALMATSAFHLQPKSNEYGLRFDHLARSFRGKAFGSLRHALRQSSNTDNILSNLEQNQSSLSLVEGTISAMLTLITMDVMEGSMSDYRIHLQGIQSIANQVHAQGQTSAQLERLLSISTFLATLSDTTSLDLPSLPWHEASINEFRIKARTSSVEYGLEFTYGITPTLVAIMRQMIRLSQSIEYYATRNIDFPQSLLAACEEIFDDLAQWSIEDEPLAQLFSGYDVSINIRIAEHHILAFADGLRVYYHTRVLPCQPSAMELYVGRVAHHLVRIEEIKTNTGMDSKSNTSVVWPGFIASCEANKGPARGIWYKWWDSMATQSIGNIAHLWKIVQQAWHLRDHENSVEVPAWMPVLRQSGKHILAV